jgi:hypothetical protein
MDTTLQDAMVDAIYRDALKHPQKYPTAIGDTAIRHYRIWADYGLTDPIRKNTASWDKFLAALKKHAGKLSAIETEETCQT